MKRNIVIIITIIIVILLIIKEKRIKKTKVLEENKIKLEQNDYDYTMDNNLELDKGPLILEDEEK